MWFLAILYAHNLLACLPFLPSALFSAIHSPSVLFLHFTLRFRYTTTALPAPRALRYLTAILRGYTPQFCLAARDTLPAVSAYPTGHAAWLLYSYYLPIPLPASPTRRTGRRYLQTATRGSATTRYAPPYRRTVKRSTFVAAQNADYLHTTDSRPCLPKGRSLPCRGTYVPVCHLPRRQRSFSARRITTSSDLYTRFVPSVRVTYRCG